MVETWRRKLNYGNYLAKALDAVNQDFLLSKQRAHGFKENYKQVPANEKLAAL